MKSPTEWNPLSKEEEQIIVYKATEYPYTGKYNQWHQAGYFVCKRCELPLYRTSDKFNSGCGWPSFDDCIAENVKQIPDADGRRMEIVCAGCGGHLGHVFEGEQFTLKNTRHCVNSLSLQFQEKLEDQ